jgi:hypothetical protein
LAVAYSRKEDAMPGSRRSTRHVEAVEVHGERITLLVVAIVEVTADGLVEPNEARLLDRLSGELLASYRPLPAEAAVIDNGIRIIGAMTDTLSPTAWVERLIREGAEDEQGLIEDGLLEPVAA